MSEDVRSPSTLPAFLSLFTSTGTLICCALPALLVSIGAGAVMAGLIEAVPQITWLGKNKGFVNAEGSMAKLKAARTATWVTERAIQILGGYGYTREYPVERWHRDAKIMDIFEGTEQIQQLVISRAISGMRIV